MQNIKVLFKYFALLVILIFLYSLQSIFNSSNSFFSNFYGLYTNYIFNLFILFFCIIMSLKFTDSLKSDYFLLRFFNRSGYNKYIVKNILFFNIFTFVLSYLIVFLVLVIVGKTNFDIGIQYYGINDIVYFIYYFLSTISLVTITCYLNVFIKYVIPYGQIIFVVVLLFMFLIPTDSFLSLNMMTFLSDHSFDSLIHELCCLFLQFVFYGGMSIVIYNKTKDI